MRLFCINKSLELIFDKKIEIDLEQLKFWLERFVPNVEFNIGNDCKFTLYIKKNDCNECIVNDDNIILRGNFSEGSESYIAKFVSQIFARLLIEDDYYLVPAACVVKNGKALLIVGDFGQGKTSLSFELFNNYFCELVSDNYIIIHENKVVAGTRHISLRKENLKYLNKQKYDRLLIKNDRYFFCNNTIKEVYPICGIVTPHINSEDQNFHVISKEESIWYLYGKFSRLLNGECILFNGSEPSPIFNDYNCSRKILNVVNAILKESFIY